MRTQALRLLSGLRAPAGALVQESFQGVRLLSSSSVTGDVSSLVQSLQGKKEEGSSSFQLKVGQQMPLSFASQMHTVSNEEKNQVVAPLPAGAKVPVAMQALPTRSSIMKKPFNRQMGTYSDVVEEHAVGYKAHPFHVLPPSPWPALAGFGAFQSMLGMTAFFHAMPGGTALMLTGIGSVAATAVAWWRDCIIESDMGMHTEVVKRNLMSGVWWFIVSEACLFFGLLWSCIHLGSSPNVTLQMQWPPVGIEAIGWDKRALVMSAVLAASYYSANVAMVAKDPKTVMAALGVTTGLGALFIGDQYLEYSTAPFTISDGPYGSTFFITTGFHGMHVMIGALWLATAMAMYPRYKNPGVGMKGAVLYWHFVDIVWIAVYGIIYVAQL